MKRFQIRKLPIVLFALSLFAAFLGACPLLRRAMTFAHADEEAEQKTGRLELEQTDALGEKVLLPVEYDGEKYILEDTLRNIYVYDASGARSQAEITNNLFPLFTSKDGVFEDGMAVSIYANVIRAYDFYTAANVGTDFFGVNGKNDQIAGNQSMRGDELPILIYAHFNAGGLRFNAAYTALSNASAMVVGDGSPNGGYSDLYMQGAAADVIAHEYQHGVTQNLAGLGMNDEPGAINEAISDIFGALIEGHDPSEEEFWLMGEDCSVSGKSMRSIKSPRSVGIQSAETLGQKVSCPTGRHIHSERCDYGNVHANSTIISHLQYTAYEIYPEYFTAERIAKLWFETLKRLNANTTFVQFSREFRAAAVALQFESKALDAIDYSLYVNGFPTSGKFHKVTFVNEDGSVLLKTIVKHGTKAEAPEAPEKAPDESYRYLFDGWDCDFEIVLNDLTVKAVFRSEPRLYSVRFYDGQGAVVKQLSNVAYSEIDSVKSADNITPPVKESTPQYSYEFDHWETSLDETLGEVEIRPVYREQVRTYTVSYFFKGKEYYSETLDYGALNLIDLPDGCLGWYLDQNCTVAANGRMIDQNLTIYGKSDGIPLYLVVTLCCVGGAVVIGAAVFTVVFVGKRRKRSKNG